MSLGLIKHKPNVIQKYHCCLLSQYLIHLKINTIILKIYFPLKFNIKLQYHSSTQRKKCLNNIIIVQKYNCPDKLDVAL